MTGRLKKILISCGLKSSSSSSSRSLDRLPKGHMRVYVGKDEVPCKFDIETHYLNHPLFKNLLLQLSHSVEEFGYSYNGALRIACDIDLFKFLLDLLESRNPCAHYMELQDLISKFYENQRRGTAQI
ncbi:Auxin-induced protein [Macleaya cordata]|uniref:Auxin-induced protein n=1 Tax=Macleaya cordata TaxID=56857 RepID=A0A200QIQ7_MACCD|nr:Auxin-induced protein [Macleaya cordata]OVA20445.1 Auxin-induced protein [Macleaya cordata]